MANRQYIGARYVPKFYEGSNGNNWDSGKAYEPLTVVTYLQDSYTSKIPVPNTVGDPAHNPKYWAHTGAYNAQVEEYREEVRTLEEQVDELVDDEVEVKNVEKQYKVNKETGRYELYIGYPFIEGKLKDDTFIKSPLFLNIKIFLLLLSSNPPYIL